MFHIFQNFPPKPTKIYLCSPYLYFCDKAIDGGHSSLRSVALGDEENFIRRNDDDASLISLVLKQEELIMLLLLCWVSSVQVVKIVVNSKRGLLGKPPSANSTGKWGLNCATVSNWSRFLIFHSLISTEA